MTMKITIVGAGYVGSGAETTESVLGPYVAIGMNATVEDSQLEDIMLESNASTCGFSARRGVISNHASLFDSAE